MEKIGRWGLFILFISFLNATERELVDLHNPTPDGYWLAAPDLMTEVDVDPSLENPPWRNEDGLPVFTEEPSRQILHPGDSLTLTVEIESAEEVRIEWYHNRELLKEQTGKTLHITAVSLEDDGKYYAAATNSAGTTYSHHARVSVRPLFVDKSVARQWMEELLDAIRLDNPAPTVHSRNLFSLSSAMWDAWAAYDPGPAVAYIALEKPDIPDDPNQVKTLRSEAISYAAYRVLRCRFRFSPNLEISLRAFRKRMEILGYDPDNSLLEGDSPAAVGNRIAAKVLASGWSDGANELEHYKDQTRYQSENAPLIFELPGAQLNDPKQWQPLAFDHFVLRNGNSVPQDVQKFLGPHWGWVTPFALARYNPSDIYQDPGPPPYLGTDTDQDFKEAALEVLEYSSWLDPTDSPLIDVSPKSRHNNTLGTNDGTGYPDGNPYTGEPYVENLVLEADYGRVLAEFWADGPDSETPPGHWNTVANYVSDHELFEKRFEGEGPVLDELEWDVKLYFCINAALSDAAIACWDTKRKYNYVRPISMIRYMGGLGQSSDADAPSYHRDGLLLKPGLVELITPESAAEGERHAHLADYVGEIAVHAWRGEPDNPVSEFGGVDWIRAVEWMPYQTPSFVTPPFAAYTSGHSTFSRSAAEVLTAITGDKYFPGGVSSFTARAHEFLVFETGPEEDLTLTWATYYDAADEAGISRIYGGIHVWADDLRGRIMGSNIGKTAYAKAKTYFTGEASTKDWDQAYEGWVTVMMTDQSHYHNRDYYETNQLEQLGRFFFGNNQLSQITPQTPMRIIKYNQTLGMGCYLDTRISSLVEFESPFLQVSKDMRIWETVSPEEATLSNTLLPNGFRHVVITFTAGTTSESARFLRIGLKESY